MSAAPETLQFLREKARRHQEQQREELAIIDEIEVLSEWLENMRNATDKEKRTMLVFRRTPAGVSSRFGTIVAKKIMCAVGEHIEHELQALKEKP
jgi:hypothetical protein